MKDKVIYTIKIKDWYLYIILAMFILLLVVWQRKELLLERLNETRGCFGC